MMDFSKYLIVTDLDGTFFAPGGKMVPRNLEALERFRAGGGLFTVATGRVHMNIRNIFGNPETVVNAPVVMANGAYLYDFSKKEILMLEGLDKDLAGELLDFALAKEGVTVRVNSRTQMRFFVRDYPQDWNIAQCDEGTVVLGDPRTWPTDDWIKFILFTQPEKKEALRAELVRAFGNRISVTSSGKALLEVQNARLSKAYGIEKLVRHLGGGERILITCGDYENDLEMHAVADVSVCPQNALPVVKEACDYTLCHCADGLIADVIEEIEKGTLLPLRKRVMLCEIPCGAF